jgi:hypothetical protein
MLVTLVISFAICWLPIQVFNLLFWLFDDLRYLSTPTRYYAYVIGYFTCHWLAMFHCVIDPIIYCFMNRNFKVINTYCSAISIFTSNYKSIYVSIFFKFAIFKFQISNFKIQIQNSNLHYLFIVFYFIF